VFEILVELSFDFLDLSLEKHFFQVHKEILQVIEKKRPEDARRLIEKDIQDVRDKLKGFKQYKRS
jgi:DNA-binding FadR family transcriptional regulator